MSLIVCTMPQCQTTAGCVCGLATAKIGEAVPMISERGRALILAAAILDRPNADPDDDLAILARQLTRAQEEIDKLNGKVKHLRVVKP